MQKPIQRVNITKTIARHTKIRDQNPPLGLICPGEPHQRSPNTAKFEDRFLEGTEWQEQGAREAALKLAKSVFKLREQERATFFSPSENRCLPASNLKPEEREFVVDSGASMHMISKKDLNSAEMDTLTKSCSPTIVITANGEVQTHEEAIVYVKELDMFLTMKVLENTPAVLLLGKLCDKNGYSYEWTNGQKPHLIKNRIRIQCLFPLSFFFSDFHFSFSSFFLFFFLFLCSDAQKYGFCWPLFRFDFILHFFQTSQCLVPSPEKREGGKVPPLRPFFSSFLFFFDFSFFPFLLFFIFFLLFFSFCLYLRLEAMQWVYWADGIISKTVGARRRGCASNASETLNNKPE